MANAVWVFAEQREGKLRKVALELLGAGRKLADQAGTELAAILVGSGVESLVPVLGLHGADVVYLADDPGLAQYATEAYAGVVARAAAEGQPSIFLFGASTMGKDLAPRVAARLGAGLASDCTALELGGDGRLVITRPVYAGKAFYTVASNSPVQMAALRPNVFPPAVPRDGDGHAARVVRVDAAAGLAGVRAKVRELVKSAVQTVELTEADIIVSGGRGIKGPENFKLLEDLAAVLGAAVGASRAAVDAGWAPHSRQVGQTGKVVSPTLYIACGISGAIQHLAGMSSSKFIVAVNKDPEAPIFKVADYGIVGDLFQVVPLLTEEFKKMKEQMTA